MSASKPWVYFKEYNICLAFMPKVANSSMKMAFAKLYNIEPFASQKDQIGIHGCKFFHERMIDIREASMINSTANIMFVRNPYDRLVSCWQSKLIDKVPNAGLVRQGFTRDMTFEDFIKLVCKIPDDIANVHFKSQMCFWLGPKTTILRFENIDDDWEIVRNKIVGLPPLPHFGSSEHNHYREYYNPELIKLVQQRFKYDLEVLGYEF